MTPALSVRLGRAAGRGAVPPADDPPVDAAGPGRLRPGPGASLRKLLGAEHEQRVQELGLAMLGPEGATMDGRAGTVDPGLPGHPVPHHRRRHQRGAAQRHRRAAPRPAPRPRARRVAMVLGQTTPSACSRSSSSGDTPTRLHQISWLCGPETGGTGRHRRRAPDIRAGTVPVAGWARSRGPRPRRDRPGRPCADRRRCRPRRRPSRRARRGRCRPLRSPRRHAPTSRRPRCR